jgi:cell division transport system permease protein
MFDKLGFVVGEGFGALRRNLGMAIAGISTGAVALFLLGVLCFVYKLADDYAKTVPNRFDMRVYLKDGVKFPEIKSTAQAIRSIAGVQQVSWIPRDKAWAKLQREQPELTQGLDNSLPDAYKVVLSDITHADQVANQIQSLATVQPDGVHYLRDEQKVAIAGLGTFRLLGPAFVALLLAATGILIYNTIRLTVVSRRLEIRITRLVGASNFTVRFPFYIEGLVQGLVAGGCAGVLLIISDRVVRDQLALQNIQFAAFPTTLATCLMVATGAGYGLLCSLLAVRAPLRYR